MQGRIYKCMGPLCSHAAACWRPAWEAEWHFATSTCNLYGSGRLTACDIMAGRTRRCCCEWNQRFPFRSGFAPFCLTSFTHHQHDSQLIYNQHVWVSMYDGGLLEVYRSAGARGGSCVHAHGRSLATVVPMTEVKPRGAFRPLPLPKTLNWLNVSLSLC